MKRKNTILLLGFGLFVIFLCGCKKDDDPPAAKPSVKDIQGNVYDIVTIGTQTWMAENLKVTQFKDTTDIPNITNNGQWGNLTTPGYCYYNHDGDSLNDIYGAMYNWFAVNSGKLCPDGWHIPTNDEWLILFDYLGGVDTAGGQLKEQGSKHWINPNIGASNASGFTALPGGYRYETGVFYDLGKNGNWWTTTEENLGNAYYWKIHNNLISVSGNSILKQRGLSVRCVKDE